MHYTCSLLKSYSPFEKWSQLHQLFPVSSMYCFSLLLNLLSQSWNSKKSTFHQDLCAIQVLTKKITWTHNPDSSTETIEEGSKKQLLIRPMIQTQLPKQFEDQWTKDTAAVHIKSGAQHQNTTASNRSGSFLVYPKTLKVNKDIQRYWEITLLWKSCPFHPNGPLETKFYFPAKISNKKHTPTDKSLLLNIHLVLQIVKSWSLRAVYHSLLAKISWQVKNSYLPYNFPHSIWQIFKADFSMTQIFKSNLKLQMFGTIWEILATEIYGTMWDSSTAHSMAVKW